MNTYRMIDKRMMTILKNLMQMKEVKPQRMGNVLTKIGAKRLHTKQGNVYGVVKLVKALSVLFLKKRAVNQITSPSNSSM